MSEEEKTEQVSKHEYTQEDLLRSFWALLQNLPGQKFQIRRHVLDNQVPEDIEKLFQVEYVPVIDAYRISIKRKRERRIIMAKPSMMPRA